MECVSRDQMSRDIRRGSLVFCFQSNVFLFLSANPIEAVPKFGTVSVRFVLSSLTRLGCLFEEGNHLIVSVGFGDLDCIVQISKVRMKQRIRSRLDQHPNDL